MEGNEKISFGTSKEHLNACCVFFIFLNIAFATKLQQLMCQFGISHALFTLFGVNFAKIDEKLKKIKRTQHEAVSCDCSNLHVSVSLLILIFLRGPKNIWVKNMLFL